MRSAPRVGARRPTLNLVLLVSTFYTLTLGGALNESARLSLDPTITGGLFSFAFLKLGLGYSLCLLAILGVHEMGHYLACRYYGVDASLPYFLPSLPIPIGTFGAFIRIRAPIPDRKVLFDIGLAGPLAGFVVTVPVLVYGLVTAEPVPIPASAQAIGDPLLLSWLVPLLVPHIREGYDIILSGPLMAGWVGCLATAINLFPIGQLDGGHVCYAISGRFHRVASITTLAGFIGMGLLVYPGWLFFATLLIVFSPRHPPVIDEREGLSTGRLVLAGVAFLVLIICFIPRPFAV